MANPGGHLLTQLLFVIRRKWPLEHMVHLSETEQLAQFSGQARHTPLESLNVPSGHIFTQ